MFEPVGLRGLLYWYGLWGIHQLVFAGMLRNIVRAAAAGPGVGLSADRPLVVNLRDECAPGAYARVLEVVAADPAERDGSRVRWAEYKRRGFDVNKHDM